MSMVSAVSNQQVSGFPPQADQKKRGNNAESDILQHQQIVILTPDT
jgi:hypothetical protein